MRDNDRETETPDTTSNSPTVSTFNYDNETVLFDIDDETRWIQSDTAVALGQIE